MGKRMKLKWVRPANCGIGACVEVACTPLGTVRIHSSSHRRRVVEFSESEWGEFITAVKQGEFDFPEVADGSPMFSAF